MKTALLIIDMQKGSFTPDAARFDVDGLVARLNALARRVRASGGLVIFIQHNGPEGDPHHPNEDGWHLLASLETEASDAIVTKTACDAFLGTTLEQVLTDNEIERLIVTGCATDYCVDTTLRSALARGYGTIAAIDGHTTADRPHLSAKKIIEHHNAIWRDFISPAGPAICLPCEQISF